VARASAAFPGGANGFNDHTWNWQLAFYGISAAEHLMATGNKKFATAMLRVNDLLHKNQKRFNNGTFGHEGNAGSNGYGPMTGTTSLAILSWAMMEKAGIPIHKDGLEKALKEMDMRLTGDDEGKNVGSYGYGWPNFGARIRAFSPEKVRPALGDLNKRIDSFNDRRSAGLPIGAMAMVHTVRP